MGGGCQRGGADRGVEAEVDEGADQQGATQVGPGKDPAEPGRQLAEEGTSFSAVHDRVRTERALELLQDAETTIASVGSQIGFNDVREFRRAFKRWTGATPSAARAR